MGSASSNSSSPLIRRAPSEGQSEMKLVVAGLNFARQVCRLDRSAQSVWHVGRFPSRLARSHQSLNANRDSVPADFGT